MCSSKHELQGGDWGLDLAKVGPDRSGVLDWYAGPGPSCWTGPMEKIKFLTKFCLKIGYSSKICRNFIPVLVFTCSFAQLSRMQSIADVTFNVQATRGEMNFCYEISCKIIGLVSILGPDRRF